MLYKPFIPRKISQILMKSKKSILLLGPRQTGKSTLMRSFNPDIIINLARESTYLEFASNPSELEERLRTMSKGTIFIDEVQRLPSILNTIQALIDENGNKYRFLLTGSSARKLKRGKANLLPGRIHVFHLGPLTCQELNYEIDIKKALSYGTLPGILLEERPDEKMLTLKTYAATYLKEEVQSESLTKNIEGFSRFIYVTAAEATHFLDLTKLSSEASIPRQSAIRYFEILEDTLIVQRCEPFSKSQRKRLIQHPRFFFFDVGVLNGLMNNFAKVSSMTVLALSLSIFIFNQLIETADALNASIRISSYRTEHGAEVDFILEKNKEITAIEVKASKNISNTDLRGLKNFQQYYGKRVRLVVLYLGEHAKILDQVEILPWKDFFKG